MGNVPRASCFTNSCSTYAFQCLAVVWMSRRTKGYKSLGVALSREIICLVSIYNINNFTTNTPRNCADRKCMCVIQGPVALANRYG